MILGLLWGCAPQLPVRTVPNAVRVMIAHTPSGELDPWLSRVVEAAERGQLTLDDVEQIERAVNEAFADGAVSEAERQDLQARWVLPEAEATSFAMDRIEPEQDDGLGVVRAWLASGWSVPVTCAQVEQETRCLAVLGHRARLARVRTRRWVGADETTWPADLGDDQCELSIPHSWSMARIRSYGFQGSEPPASVDVTGGRLDGELWWVEGQAWTADGSFARRFCSPPQSRRLGVLPSALGPLGDEAQKLPWGTLELGFRFEEPAVVTALVAIAVLLPGCGALCAGVLELIDHERTSLHPVQGLVFGSLVVSAATLALATTLSIGGSAFWRAAALLHLLGTTCAVCLALTAALVQLARLLRPAQPRRFDIGGAVALVVVSVAHGVGLRHLSLRDLDWDLVSLLLAPLYLFWAFSCCWVAGERLGRAQRYGRSLVIASVLAHLGATFVRWSAVEGALPVAWALGMAVAIVLVPPRRSLHMDGLPVLALAPVLTWLAWAQIEPVAVTVPVVGAGGFVVPMVPSLPLRCEPMRWDLGPVRQASGSVACSGQGVPDEHLLAITPVDDLDFRTDGETWLALDRGRGRLLVHAGAPSWLRGRHADGVFVRPVTYTRFHTDDGEIWLSELADRARGKPLIFDTVSGWTVQDWLQICAHVGASECHLQRIR